VLANGGYDCVDVQIGQIALDDNGMPMTKGMKNFKQFHTVSKGFDTIPHGHEFPGDEFSNVSIPFDEDN
jgi:hypothetical protein